MHEDVGGTPAPARDVDGDAGDLAVGREHGHAEPRGTPAALGDVGEEGGEGASAMAGAKRPLAASRRA